MLDTLTADDFRPHIGASFDLTPTDGEPIATELIEVSEGTASDAPRQPFSLLFRAPADTSAEQGVFNVAGGGNALEAVFLVPLGPHPDGNGMIYEAVFA